MSSIADETTIEKLSSMLIDTSLPLKLRFRILFTLKNLDNQGQYEQQQSEKTSKVVEAISQAFKDTSALLKHECAYCLGQMGNKHAITKLIQILNDSHEDPMVRHEAGEALGALGCFDNQDVINALTTQSQNPRAEISETCQIALDRLSWLRKNISNSIEKIYSTIDPAPPLTITSIDELKKKFYLMKIDHYSNVIVLCLLYEILEMMKLYLLFVKVFDHQVLYFVMKLHLYLDNFNLSVQFQHFVNNYQS